MFLFLKNFQSKSTWIRKTSKSSSASDGTARVASLLKKYRYTFQLYRNIKFSGLISSCTFFFLSFFFFINNYFLCLWYYPIWWSNIVYSSINYFLFMITEKKEFVKFPRNNFFLKLIHTKNKLKMTNFFLSREKRIKLGNLTNCFCSYKCKSEKNVWHLIDIY